jgi:hypothetical protein
LKTSTGQRIDNLTFSQRFFEFSETQVNRAHESHNMTVDDIVIAPQITSIPVTFGLTETVSR